MTNQIPLLDLVAQYQSIKPEIATAIQRVLDSGHFILGPEVAALEEEVAAYLGVKSGIGVASGTDALILALRALDIGPGDEVIIPAYTFFATISAIMHVGAIPILVDIEPKTYCIDVDHVQSRITPNTRAIIPVHLYGHPANLTALREITLDRNIKLIEDNAQAFGADHHGSKTGAIGDIGCLSFFPSKNLGGYGDGGMVVTNDVEIAKKVKMLRTHGWQKKYFPEFLGYNSRLDALQAAILRVKLPHLDSWNDRRREIANIYDDRLSHLPGLSTPFQVPGNRHVYHLYIIRVQNRNQVQETLKQQGIASGIYYPQPIHLTEACQNLNYQLGDFPVAEEASHETLSIPIFPEMTPEQIDKVVSEVENSQE